MTTYTAENIETGEIIKGGARDIAKKIGVAQGSIFNAVSSKQKVRRVWVIKCNVTTKKSTYCIPQELWAEWAKATEPFKKAIKDSKKGKSRIKLRTMYNVGIY